MDKDLGNISLSISKVDHIFLDSLASLASLASSMVISELTIQSKHEHKHRGIWAINVYKEICHHWNLKSYAFS